MRRMALLIVLALGVFREPIRELFVSELHPTAGLLSILPMSVLIIAMTLLAGAGRELWAGLRRPTLPYPPSSRLRILAPLALLTGGVMGRPGGDFVAGQTLWPFLFLCLGLAGLSLSRRPSPGQIRDLMDGLTAARWFYLGALLATPSLRSSAVPPNEDLLAYALLFLALHFATRKVRRVDTQRFPEPNEILGTYDAQSTGMVVELCAVLPASLLLGVGSRLSPADGLPGYLALLTVNAFLLKWTVEGPRFRYGVWGRTLASVSRVLTALIGLSLVSTLLTGRFDELLTPVLGILFSLGVIGGRPWGSQPNRELTGQTLALSKKGRTLGRGFWWATAAALACLAIVVASAPHDSADCQGEAPSIRARRLLEATSGWRFRLESVTETSAVLAYQSATVWDRKVTAEQIAEAEDLVSCIWPAARLTTVEVRSGVWESLNEALGALVLLSQLVLLGLLFGVVPPPQGQLWSRAISAGAGLFGAFGLAGAWGWIWINSGAAFLGFGYLTLMAAADPEALRQHYDLGRFRVLLRDVWARLLTREPESSSSLPIVEVVLGSELTKLDRGLAEELQAKLSAWGFSSLCLRVVTETTLLPNQYGLRYGPKPLAQGVLYPEGALAVGPASRLAPLGTLFTEPSHGLPAVWLPLSAEGSVPSGCQLLNAGQVLLLQLETGLRGALEELMEAETAQAILDSWATEEAERVEVVRKRLSAEEVAEVFRRLLADGLRLSNRAALLRGLSVETRTLDEVYLACRQELRHDMAAANADGAGVMNVISVRPESRPMERLLPSLIEAIEEARQVGYVPLVLAPAGLAVALRQSLHGYEGSPVVLSGEEISERYPVRIVGTV